MKKLDTAYFDSNGYCREHSELNCDECMEDSQSPSRAVAIVSNMAGPMGNTDSIAFDNFYKQVRFVKKVLKMDTEAIAKKKVTELPALVKEAQQKITIGDLSEYISDEKKPLDGVKRFLKAIF